MLKYALSGTREGVTQALGRKVMWICKCFVGLIKDLFPVSSFLI